MKKPGEDVLHDALRAEAERDTGDRGRRDQARERHAEPLQHQHTRDRVDQREHRPRDHLRERVPVLRGFRPHDARRWRRRSRRCASVSCAPNHDDEPAEQHRADDEQDDLEAVAACPPAEVAERRDRQVHGRHLYRIGSPRAHPCRGLVRPRSASRMRRAGAPRDSAASAARPARPRPRPASRCARSRPGATCSDQVIVASTAPKTRSVTISIGRSIDPPGRDPPP